MEERTVSALTSAALLALAIRTAFSEPSTLHFILFSLLAIPAFGARNDHCTANKETTSSSVSQSTDMPGSWPAYETTKYSLTESTPNPNPRPNKNVTCRPPDEDRDRKRADSACDVTTKPSDSDSPSAWSLREGMPSEATTKKDAAVQTETPADKSSEILRLHQEEIHRIRSEHAAELAELRSQISDASPLRAEIASLKAERDGRFDRLRTEHEEEMKKLRETSEQALQRNESKVAELLQQLDQQRQKIENELAARLVVEEEANRKEQKKKEALELVEKIAELTRELEISTEKHHHDLQAAHFEAALIRAQLENDQRRHVTETNYLKSRIAEIEKNVTSAVAAAVFEAEEASKARLKEERKNFEATMGALMDKMEMFARRG